MNLTSRLSHSLDQDASARAFLGDDHPLVRVDDWLGALQKQALGVAVIGTLSLVALADGMPAAPVVLAVVATAAALAVTGAALAHRKREHALDLIAAGREDLPIAAVRRERCRLRDPHHREELARWLEAISEEARHPIPSGPCARPLFNLRVVATLQADVDATARALRATQSGARGVLRAERLLEQGASPLYGPDPDALRRELRLIRFLLER